MSLVRGPNGRSGVAPIGAGADRPFPTGATPAGELEIGVAASAAAAWAMPVAVCPAGAGRVLGGALDGIVDDVATALSVGVGALVVVVVAVPAHAPAKTATAGGTTAPHKALCQRSRSRRPTALHAAALG